MKLIDKDASEGFDRFDQVERLLSRYPAITVAEVEDLKSWFNKEASAFEVASLASKESIQTPYSAFRAEHIDGFKVGELLAVGAVAVLVAVVILLLAV